MLLLFIKKLSKIIRVQYTLFCFLIVALLQTSIVNAQPKLKIIELSSLGGYEINFAKIKKVASINNQSLMGEIGYLPGENYSINFPFDVQRVSYLIKNGSLINQGDIIAKVEGYDVHHFIDEYTSAKVLLDIQEKHFQTNKKYFENQTIKSSQWIEITKSYYAAQLNFEHMQHLMSFLSIDKNEQISLVSPVAGIIKIPDLVGSKSAGDIAFDIIDINAIKVKITVPVLLANKLSYFNVSPTCKLNLHSIEKITNKFHRTIWATPDSTHCKLSVGQVIKVTPVQKVQGYKIAKSAIFEYEDINYIAIKNKINLTLIPINIIGTEKNTYLFTTNENIDDQLGLISSVSILQGNLLSLGAE